jgi:hypothetical protein
MQNFAPPGTSAPQLGQRRSSVAPQDMQNRARSGFSVPQLAQDAIATRVPAPTATSGPNGGPEVKFGQR